MARAGIFQDYYSFTIADPGSVSGNVSTINVYPYNIVGLTVTLQDASLAVVGSDSTPTDGFAFGGLSAGIYTLGVLGLANGLQGFYAGGLAAQAVPEPEAYSALP